MIIMDPAYFSCKVKLQLKETSVPVTEVSLDRLGRTEMEVRTQLLYNYSFCVLLTYVALCLSILSN